MRALAFRCKHRTSKSNIPVGFGGCASLIAFEHGCPNNSPPILWDAGGHWTPIFPNRGIPTDLRPYFDTSNPAQEAETLWDYGQYKLALGLLDHVQRHQMNPTEWQLLLALGHSSRTAWDDDRLCERLLLPITEVISPRVRAYRLGVLNTQTHQLTILGQELLSLAKKGRNEQSSKIRRSPPLLRLTDLYYPDSCGGVAKHQSNAIT